MLSRNSGAKAYLGKVQREILVLNLLHPSSIHVPKSSLPDVSETLLGREVESCEDSPPADVPCPNNFVGSNLGLLVSGH